MPNVSITFLAWLIQRFAKSCDILDVNNMTAMDSIRIENRINYLNNLQLLQLFELYQTTTGE